MHFDIFIYKDLLLYEYIHPMSEYKHMSTALCSAMKVHNCIQTIRFFTIRYWFLNVLKHLRRRKCRLRDV